MNALTHLLLPTLRRKRQLVAAAILPALLGSALLIFLATRIGFHHVGTTGSSPRQNIFVVLIVLCLSGLATTLPWPASKAFLRGRREVSELLSQHGTTRAYLLILSAQLLRGLLMLWACLPVFIFAARMLRPERIALPMLQLHLACLLVTLAGVLPSTLAPSRFVSAGLAYGLLCGGTGVIGALSWQFHTAGVDGDRVLIGLFSSTLLAGSLLGLYALRIREAAPR